MAAVAALIATVVSVITETSGILGVAYIVYTVCIIKRVWVFISSVTSSSLTTQLTAGNQKWQKRPRGRKKTYSVSTVRTILAADQFTIRHDSIRYTLRQLFCVCSGAAAKPASYFPDTRWQNDESVSTHTHTHPFNGRFPGLPR